MQTTIQQGYTPSISAKKSHISPWKKFINWSNEQEKNRLGWAAGIIAGHGCVFTILTVATIVLTGNNFIFWPFAIGAMAACLITNLAAMPTKITLPVFFISLLIDVAIIVLCLANGITISQS